MSIIIFSILSISVLANFVTYSDGTRQMTNYIRTSSPQNNIQSSQYSIMSSPTCTGATPPVSGSWTISNASVSCSDGNLNQVTFVYIVNGSTFTLNNVNSNGAFYVEDSSNITLIDSDIEQLQIEGDSVNEINNTIISKVTFGNNSQTLFYNSNISTSIGAFGNPFVRGNVDMPDCYEVHSWPTNANLTREFVGYLYNRTNLLTNFNITYENLNYVSFELQTDAQAMYKFNITYNKSSYKQSGTLELNQNLSNSFEQLDKFAEFGVFRDTPINSSLWFYKINFTDVDNNSLDINYSVSFVYYRCSNVGVGAETDFNQTYQRFQAAPFMFLDIDPEDSSYIGTLGQYDNSITNYSTVDISISKNNSMQDLNLTIPLMEFRNDRFFDSPINVYPANLSSNMFNRTYTLTTYFQGTPLNYTYYAYFYSPQDDITQLKYSNYQYLILNYDTPTSKAFGINFTDLPPINYTVISSLRTHEYNASIGVEYDSISYVKRNMFKMSLIYDTDGDGTPDDQDDDDDNDGINDTEDFLNGNESNVITNIVGFNITVNNTDNLSNQFQGVTNITIKEGNDTIVDIPFNFSNSSTLDLSQLIIRKQGNSSERGGIVISGVTLTGDLKKTVYMDKVGSSTSVCIRDAEVALLSQITDDCVGTSEIILNCNGVQAGDYTCTDLGTEYKITGLTHSGVQEILDGDFNPPIISNIQNTTPASTVNITWTTNENANSSVNYGVTLSLGDYSSDVDFDTSHSVALSILQGNVTYYYNITSCDISDNCNTSGPSNFTTPVFYTDEPPLIRLNSPLNAANYSNTSVTFNCTVSDDVNLTNVTLYGNWSGWHANSTNTSNINASYIFTNILVAGSYAWNCYACDNASNCSYATTNRTFTIDITAPPTAPNVTSVTDSNNDGNLEINWTLDSNAVTYGVFRNTSNISSITEGLRIANATGINFTDNTTVHGVEYWYAVTSIDASGNENISIINISTGLNNGTANDSIYPRVPTYVNGTYSSNVATINWSNVLYDIAGNNDSAGLQYQVWYGTAINMSKSFVNDTLSLLKNVSSNTTTWSIPSSCGSSCNYYFVLTTLDDAGNRNLTLNQSNMINLTLAYSAPAVVDTPSGGGGGGGGSIPVPEISFTDDNANFKAYTSRFYSLKVKNVSHKFRIGSINSTHIKFTISSDPITDVLELGESKTYDVDSNGLMDLYIKLNAVEYGKANVSINRLQEKEGTKATGHITKAPIKKEDARIVPTNIIDPEEEINDDTIEEGNNIFIYIGIIVIVVILLVGLFIFFKFKPHKTKKSIADYLKNLDNYINASLKKGKGKEEIEDTLVHLGWKKDVVETELDKCEKK
jgi:hypothetical protein